MKVRVLGCSGAIARECRTTSFLIDGDLLVDAGTGVGDLPLHEMRAITHVLLTHSHLDHFAALPLMVDSIASQLTQPVKVYALAGTIAALKAHIFNNVIWPDFSSIPSRESPFVSFHEVTIGQQLQLGTRAPKVIEVLPAVHTVPACGYAVRCAQGKSHWVFSGDTERNAPFWARVNQLEVALLVIETAFSNREQALAQRSLHLSPITLADELAQIAPGRNYPIYITHTKPAETEEIMSQIDGIADSAPPAPSGGGRAWDIRWLQAAEVLQV